MTMSVDTMGDMSVPVPDGSINVWHRPGGEDSVTAVLIHGLSGNSRWWGRVIAHLPDHTGVIALDARGRAGSADAPPPYDLTTIADDIGRVLDHIELDRAVVAGYSMGGWVAALFGVRHPARAQRLVLVDGGFPLPRDPDADVEEIIDAVVGPSLRRLDREFATRDAYLDYWRAHPAFVDHWEDSMEAPLGHELEAHRNGFRVRANRGAIEMAAREITVGREANEASAHLEVASHLIVVERGTTDQPGGMIPLEVAEEAAAANSELTMQFLADVNHYTLLLGRGAHSVAAAIAPGWLPS